MKHIPLSYSRWKDADCPHRFNAMHIERSYKEPESDAMRRGGNVHLITEQYRRHCYQTRRLSDLEWLSRKIDSIEDQDVRQLVQNFSESAAVNLPMDAEWVQIEGRFAFGENLALLDGGKDGWFDPEVRFRMVLDFAYSQGDTLYLVDDKTGRGDPDSLQLELYAYLASQVYLSIHKNKPIRRIVCVFNELGKRKLDSWEYTPSEVRDVRRKIFERLELVNSWKEYPAIACGQCKWCSVPGCPVRESAAKALVETTGCPTITIPDAITTPGDAEKAVLFLLFADGVVDGVKDILRAYVEANGPVAAGGKVAELRENEPWKCGDLEKTVKTLVAYGAPPALIWDQLSLSESGIEKICKKAKIKERLPMVLQTMGERKAYKPKFGLYNDKV